MAATPKVTAARISQHMLTSAKRQCTATSALPNDWDTWFPGVIPLELESKRPDVTVSDIINYVRKRLLDTADPFRFIEAAQCCALLHFCGAPSLDTIVATFHCEDVDEAGEAKGGEGTKK